MNVNPPAINPSEVPAAWCKQIEADRAVLTAALALKDSLQAELPDLKAQLAALLESGANDDAAVAELSRLRTKVELGERKLQKVVAEIKQTSNALADSVYEFVQKFKKHSDAIWNRVNETVCEAAAKARAPFRPELDRLASLDSRLADADYRARGDHDALKNSSRVLFAWSEFVKESPMHPGT